MIPLAILSILLAYTSAETEDIVKEELAVAVDLALQRASAFGFSGAVLIALEGEVILSKGYGWADRS